MAETVELTELAEARPLAEAAPQSGEMGRRQRIMLINAGWGSSGYYGADVLRKAAENKVFKAGTHLYMNHPTATESVERPERDVLDLAAVLATDAVYDEREKGLLAVVETFPRYRQVLAEMKDHIGLSIRASGTVEYGEAEGRAGPIITALTEAQSVDYVTRAGRGGRIVELLEAARAQPDNDRKAGLLGKATEAIVPLAEATQDTKPLSEARNVGHWLESRIHLAFTEMCDDMFGQGRLTREERITLSNAIGEGLTAFNTVIAEKVPHLYQRDLWDDPEPAPAEVSETASKTEAPTIVPAPPAASTKEGAPMSGGTNQQGTPPDGGALTETEVSEAAASARAAVAEAERDQYRASAQALTEAQQAQARALAERDAAIAESRRLIANDAARRSVSRLVAESGMPGEIAVLVAPRVEGAVLDRVPLNESGQPNVQALDAAIVAAIEAERTYAARLLEAHGVGDVRGLGGSTEAETLSESDLNGALERVFSGIGLNADVAKAAAKGRVNI
ncbi:hypothetical protein JYK22_21460, partial [Nonomuraea sp. RK-328]|nr:hypothetical protein [Nonomuraea sp. RK-328]